jgi:Protein of unknown function (DUF2783)
MLDLGQDRLGKYGDEFYEKLMAAHHGLSEAGSARLNARLVLIMANAIGDAETLDAIIKKASQT